MKKIATLIFVHVVLPFLQEILAQVMRQCAGMMIGVFRSLLQKWHEKDLEAASSEDEKEQAKRRFEERMQQFDETVAAMPDKMEDIVRQTFVKAQPNQELLVDSLQSDVARLSSGKSGKA
ncbi:hypothetical protein [Pelomonas cellulosilytica]|uniref:Uncharacterized protein n=1 Tax=Pelomonas cellulosilytica TaxID=2906762 RepID=A0ABS8XW13_9BURK|nr:hypothetical protein [Pelomonas sp. P8]MCE4555475.1 hypothetical protein [Pelomonas sp. P8]